MLSDYLKISFLMMRSKPVRSALSLLGIYIGVLALALILGIREGVRRQLSDLFRTEGARLVFVHPGFDPVSKRIGRMTGDDLELLRGVPGILSVQPRRSADIEVRTSAGTERAKAVGVDEGFMGVFRVKMIRGRNFLESEIKRKSPVCLITAELVRKLFPVKEPVGAVLDLRGVPFQVIGIVDWDAATAQRTVVNEVDVLLPPEWLTQSDDFIAMTEVRVRPDIAPDQAVAMVKKSLSRGHPEREPLYFVRSMEQFVERNKAMTDKVMTGLLGIAAISLLVGGIGVANVMVTSVTERTREIGIRKALGARRVDILLQFLMEAIVLSGSGGFLAVASGGTLIAVLPALIKTPIPVAAPWMPLLACLGLTMFIGLLAGLYPASRAASLSPAEALRYE
jgi:ABC-type antimicrobial peptide transport system permease subunit